MTAIDQKWLIRIILGKVQIGLGQQKIMLLLHPKASTFYTNYSNLSRVCEIIESGSTCNETLENTQIELGQPVHPMLCQRINIANLEELIASAEYYVETKMDGERFQVHIQNEKYKYFSRRCYDYSNIFGPDASQGTLTPFIIHLFKIPVKDIILDGEMMVWNRDEQRYHEKAENTDVKSLKTSDATRRPCFVVYDILYLNGSCLINKPYAERVRLLQSVVKDKEGFMVVSETIKIQNSQHILQSLNLAIDERKEGIVIKQADSKYAPGMRNAGWCKIKPDVNWPQNRIQYINIIFIFSMLMV